MRRIGTFLVFAGLLVAFALEKGAQAASVSTNVERYVLEASFQYGINPNLIAAVIQAESNFNAGAVSPRGAIGLMQLMPATARAMNVDPEDEKENVLGGIKYLNYLYEEYIRDGRHDPETSLALLLACYNAGPDRVFGGRLHPKVPNIEETQKYVAKTASLFKKNGNGLIKSGETKQRKNIEPRFASYAIYVGDSEAGEKTIHITQWVYAKAGEFTEGKVVFSFFDDCKIISATNAEIYHQNRMVVVECKPERPHDSHQAKAHIRLKSAASRDFQYYIRVEMEDPMSMLKKVSYPYHGVLDPTGYPAKFRR